MEILEKTMQEMPVTFTSNEFNKRAVYNGYPQKALKHKGLHRFIKRYADNAYLGSKTWIKKTKTTSKTTEKEMIEHLKRKGYKIMKPKTEWEEL